MVGSDAVPGSQFGESVAIKDRAILVGAPYQGVIGEGCSVSLPDGNAYVFLPYRRTWFESQTLNGYAQFCARFGNDVAMDLIPAAHAGMRTCLVQNADTILGDTDFRPDYACALADVPSLVSPQLEVRCA